MPTIDEVLDYTLAYNFEASKENTLIFRHPNKEGGVVIGKEYDLKSKSEEEVKNDLNKAKFPKAKTDIILKAIGLTGAKASEFVKNNKNFKLTEKEQSSLFQATIPKYVNQARKVYFAKYWDELPKYLKELLVDLIYKGECRENFRKKYLYPALDEYLKNKSVDKFEKLLKDPTLFKCTKEHLASRLGHLELRKKEKESDSLNSSQITADSEVEIENAPKGGVDLSYKYDDLIKNSAKIKFNGIINDKSKNLFYTIESKTKNSKYPVNLEDLAVVLKILYDPTIKHKSITFSLDPYEKNKPDGPFMRKVFYPDEYEKRKIVEGTKLGEELFKADFLLKQMSLGFQPDNKTPFKYPKELYEKGLKPKSEMGKVKEQQGSQWSRSWIVINNLKTKQLNNSMFFVNNIVMGVDARQMNTTKEGCLEDSKIQDKTDQCYLFSEKMTQLYDDISRHYSSFNRMKEIVNAIALGKWLYQNKVPVDMDMIEKIYKKSLIPGYSNKVPSIHHEESKREEVKKKIELGEVIRRSLTKSKIEINEKTIAMAKDQIIKKVPSAEFYDTVVKTVKKFVFGGVDLSNVRELELCEKKKEDDNLSSSSASTIGDDDDFADCIKMKKGKIVADFKKCDIKKFPFVKEEKCQTCKKVLKQQDLQESFQYQNLLKGKYYCHEHFPYKCEGCHKIAEGKVVMIKEKYYHQNCLVCPQCGLSFKDKFVFDENSTPFHQNCLIEFYKHDKELKDSQIIQKAPSSEKKPSSVAKK